MIGENVFRFQATGVLQSFEGRDGGSQWAVVVLRRQGRRRGQRSNSRIVLVCAPKATKKFFEGISIGSEVTIFGSVLWVDREGRIAVSPKRVVENGKPITSEAAPSCP